MVWCSHMIAVLSLIRFGLIRAPSSFSGVACSESRGKRKRKEEAQGNYSSTQNVTEAAGTNQTHLELASGDGARPGVHARSHG